MAKTSQKKRGLADIFSRTEPGPLSEAPSAQVVKTTVLLTVDNLDYLDRESLAIRRKRGKQVSRTEIVRGIIVAMAKAEFSLADCSSEEAIAEHLEGFFRRAK